MLSPGSLRKAAVALRHKGMPPERRRHLEDHLLRHFAATGELNRLKVKSFVA
jgi:hypothetical protein